MKVELHVYVDDMDDAVEMLKVHNVPPIGANLQWWDRAYPDGVTVMEQYWYVDTRPRKINGHDNVQVSLLCKSS